MAAETKTRNVYYKCARFISGKGNLKDVLTSALRQRAAAGKRQEIITAHDGARRLINSHRSQMGMLFGNLLVYSPGTNHALLTVDEDKTELDVAQIAPPVRNGKRTEFLDSMLYFGILGNHVILLQSPGLKANAMEAHLNWLLRECTKVLPDDDGVVLSDQALPHAKDKIKTKKVKSVSIGMPLSASAAAAPASQTKHVKKLKYEPSGNGFEILRQVLGDNWFRTLKLEDSLADAHLKVVLDISYERTTTEKAQQLLDNIATSMRHVDEDHVAVHLKGGGILKGEDLKIFGPVSVMTHSGLIDQSDLYPKMHAWLMEKIEQKLILP